MSFSGPDSTVLLEAFLVGSILSESGVAGEETPVASPVFVKFNFSLIVLPPPCVSFAGMASALALALIVLLAPAAPLDSEVRSEVTVASGTEAVAVSSGASFSGGTSRFLGLVLLSRGGPSPLDFADFAPAGALEGPASDGNDEAGRAGRGLSELSGESGRSLRGDEPFRDAGDIMLVCRRMNPPRIKKVKESGQAEDKRQVNHITCFCVIWSRYMYSYSYLFRLH